MGTLFQDLAAQFNQAFIEADRWQRYLSGIGISFTVTLGALIIGIILGVLVAIVRTLHDQQKGTERSVLLGIVNKFCEFYTTVIRGTPMMVQLLIMGFVIFKSSRNLVGVAILSLGINSGWASTPAPTRQRSSEAALCQSIPARWKPAEAWAWIISRS